MNGSMDLSLNSSGAAQVPLSGSALVAESGDGCEGGGYYAKIRDIRSGASWYDSLIGLAVEGSDTITLTANETKAVRVYGVFGNGSSRLIEPAKLNEVISAGTATISNGVISAGTNPEAGTLTITVTEKPAVKLVVTITV